MSSDTTLTDAALQGAVRTASLMKPLWPHQSRGLKLLRAAAPKHGRVLVVAPTGCGKTFLGAHVCMGAVARGSRVLWVTHTIDLLTQSASVFTEHGLRVGIIQADRPRDPGAPVQVGSCQTLIRRNLDAYDIIVFDEVHLYVGTETAAWIIASSPRAQVIGLTASPWRLDGKPMGLLFNCIIQLATYAELIAFGALVPSRVFAPPRSRPDLSEVHIVHGEFDKREVEELVSEPEVVGDIVSTYDRNAWTPFGHRQAVVFAHSIAHSLQLRDAFRACGHRAEHLDFRTPARDRERLLERFKAGEIDVLCNKDILTAGFDHPGLGCVIDASPTMSLARYRQRIGRGMRADVGKRDLLVHDHSGNVFRHGFAHADREWTLDDARQESPKDSMPSLRTCGVCFAVFSPAPICPACGHAFPVEARELKQRDGVLEEIQSVETDDVRHRREFFLELCAKAVALKTGRGFVKMKYRDRFGSTPKFDYPPELPENLGQKRLGLERFAQSRGYSAQWVDAQMEKRR